MNLSRHKFNQLTLSEKAHVITAEAKYVDWFVAYDYFYHVYHIDGEFVVVQYDSEIKEVVDMLMMDNQDLFFICEYINIDDVWK